MGKLLLEKSMVMHILTKNMLAIKLITSLATWDKLSVSLEKSMASLKEYQEDGVKRKRFM